MIHSTFKILITSQIPSTLPGRNESFFFFFFFFWRDKGLHYDFACLLCSFLRKKLSEEQVKGIVRHAVDRERERERGREGKFVVDAPLFCSGGGWASRLSSSLISFWTRWCALHAFTPLQLDLWCGSWFSSCLICFLWPCDWDIWNFCRINSFLCICRYLCKSTRDYLQFDFGFTLDYVVGKI